jgi:3-oxoacyl-[acyl-carrier protein] reductase
MTKDLTVVNKNEYLNDISLNRFGEAEDVANLVSFLASDNASYITGQVINIDGGIN